MLKSVSAFTIQLPVALIFDFWCSSRGTACWRCRLVQGRLCRCSLSLLPITYSISNTLPNSSTAPVQCKKLTRLKKIWQGKHKQNFCSHTNFDVVCEDFVSLDILFLWVGKGFGCINWGLELAIGMGK